MMKFKFKRITAMILAGMMTVNVGTAAFAKDRVWSVEENTNVTEQMKSYITDQAPILVYAAGIADPSSCKLSNIFPIYDSKGLKTNRNISFIIQNDNIVGDIVVAPDKNGSFSASSELRDYPEVNEAFHSGAAISFYCYENDFIMTNGKTALVLLSEYGEEGPAVSKTFNSLSDIEVINISLSPVFSNMQVAPISIPENMIYSTQYSTVNFDSRANMVGQGERGTCWAACVASKVCYESPGYDILSADDVYDAVIAAFNKTGSKRTRYERGLAAYDIPIDSSFTGIYPFNVLQSKTQSDSNLIIMRLQNDDGDDAHAVLLKGYQIINPIEGSVYLLMDPNNTKHHVAVSISSNIYNGKSGFTYVSKIGSYTWFDSICTGEDEEELR